MIRFVSLFLLIFVVACSSSVGAVQTADVLVGVTKDGNDLKVTVTNNGSKDLLLVNPFGTVIIPGDPGMEFLVRDGDGSRVMRCSFVTPGADSEEVFLGRGRKISNAVSLSYLAHLYCLQGKYRVQVAIRQYSDMCNCFEEWWSKEIEVDLKSEVGRPYIE